MDTLLILVQVQGGEEGSAKSIALSKTIRPKVEITSSFFNTNAYGDNNICLRNGVKSVWFKNRIAVVWVDEDIWLDHKVDI